MLRHVLQSGWGYPNRLLVFQCPVGNTPKSNCCVYVCLNICPLLHASWQEHHCQLPPPCYFCICSAVQLNPFQSKLNLRARYTPSRNMPYDLHSSVQHTHTHTHTLTHSPHLITQNSHLVSFEMGSILHQCKEKSHQLISPHFSDNLPRIRKQGWELARTSGGIRYETRCMVHDTIIYCTIHCDMIHVVIYCNKIVH